MFRKDLLELLRAAPRSVEDIALLLELEPRDVEDDLRHLLKSVRHTGYRVTITPARCRHCDFRFRSDKLHKPGKCPRCRQTWISPPLIQIAGPEAP
jgi:predicted Zn-ribbon and HTH transcriptional regulator